MIKRFSIAIFLCMILTAAAEAQSPQFGLRFGPSFTTVGGDGFEPNAFVVGYHIGGYYQVPMEGKFTFEPGLQWSTKGSAISFVGLPASGRSRNSYLDIPLLVKYNASKSVFLLFGAQPSFLLNSVRVIRSNGDKIVDEREVLRDSYNTFDLAGIVGLGANMGLGFNVQLTYEHGLTNITSDSSTEFNRGFKLSIGKSF